MDFEKEKLIIRSKAKHLRKQALADLGLKAFTEGVKFVYQGETVNVAVDKPPRDPVPQKDGSSWFPYKENGRLRRHLKTGRQSLAVMGEEDLESKTIEGQTFERGVPTEANTPNIAKRCIGSGAFIAAPEEKAEKPKKAPKKKAAPVSLEGPITAA